jgi:hypothetical protein
MSSEIPFHNWMKKELLNKQKRGRNCFYKYQSLKEKIITIEDMKAYSINYTIDNLSKNLLYFSVPSNFNDPFDSKIYVDNKAKEEQWISHLCNKYKCDPDEAKIKMKGYKKYKDGLISPPNRILFEYMNVPRVCCFSGRCDSILMWSHYADHHKGICLCFRATANFDDYYIPLRIPSSETPINYARMGLLEEVQYDKGLIPKINPFDDPIKNDKIISERLLTKFEDWYYEEEYRIIHPDHREYNASPLKSSETLEYYKECLIGIIFGCNINKNDAQRVYDAINKNNLSEESNKTVINYYQAIESLDKCELRFEQITDMNEFIDSL